jgi:hypothetical protein
MESTENLPFTLRLQWSLSGPCVRFKNLENIVQLSVMLVDTNKGMTYNLVYKLLKLVLTLPVATASVERLFSSMTFVKNKLRNKMGNQLVNDFWLHLMRRSSSYKWRMKWSNLAFKLWQIDHIVISFIILQVSSPFEILLLQWPIYIFIGWRLGKFSVFTIICLFVGFWTPKVKFLDPSQPT